MRWRLRAAAFGQSGSVARPRHSVLVVVSEETGAISVAIGGMLKRHLSPEILQKMLESELLGDELRNRNEKSRIAAIRDKWKGGAGK